MQKKPDQRAATRQAKPRFFGWLAIYLLTFLASSAAIFLASSAWATVLADWSLVDLAKRSDLIVIGTVQTQDYIVDKARGAVVTETTIKVERTLMGKNVPSFILTQLGGRAGSVITEVMGDANLTLGERVLLFTFGHEDKNRYLVGMALGAYVVLEANEPGGPLRLLQTIESPLADDKGRIRTAPGERENTIDDVKAAIEEVASAGPAATSQRIRSPQQQARPRTK